MNKKVIIVGLVVISMSIIAIIAWLYIQNTSDQPVTKSSISDLPSTNTLPVVTKPVANTGTVGNLVKSSPGQTESITEDYFRWARIIFFNENNDSKRLQGYFDRTSIDQKMVLDKCNLASDQVCLGDFKAIIKSCNLSGEEWSYLPLAFDRSTGRCYTSYADIVAYLNSELETINKNRK